MKRILQLFNALIWRVYYYCCPDKIYLNRKFIEVFGRKINWHNPKTYNEKLQWIKIYDRNPLYTKMVDKYEVREYIETIIGKEYLIPCFGVWDSFDDIDFNILPNQFVLKCTHDSNSVIICRDKSLLDKNAVRNKLTKHLKNNYYYNAREWPYKHVKPRIIAEKYMEDMKTVELRDYKFFAFDGITKACFIASDRQKNGTECKFDFFDTNFNSLNIQHGHPNSKVLPDKPVNFDKMMDLANKISKGFPEMRIDFYECNGNIFFGEITFFHHSGFVPFLPEKWDDIFGTWIKLPKKP